MLFCKFVVWSVIQDGCGKTLTSLQREVVKRCGKRLGVKSMIDQKDGECTAFPDPNLHNAVCERFEMQDDCEISCEEPGFSYTTSAYFNNRGIEDITGIERLVNIRTLLLDNNGINNISSISNLNNLNNLILSNNQISNISSISNLNNLINLNLSNNQIIDITPVSDLTNLRHLYLSNNTGILDFQPLVRLPALTLLFVSGIPSAYSPENCQVLNGLTERGVEINGFDPDQCEEVYVEVCEPEQTTITDFVCGPYGGNRPFTAVDLEDDNIDNHGQGYSVTTTSQGIIQYTPTIDSCFCYSSLEYGEYCRIDDSGKKVFDSSCIL